MAREIKIGLTVIVVLLIVFGVVLYNRLTGSPNGLPSSVADEQTDSENGEASPEPQKSGKDPADGPQMPTIIAAQAGSEDWTQIASPSYPDEWVDAGHKSAAADNKTDNRADSSRPDIMPTLVGASSHAQASGSPVAEPAGQTSTGAGPPPSLFADAVPQADAGNRPLASTPGPFTTAAILNSVRQSDPQQSSSADRYGHDQNPLRDQSGAAAGTSGYQYGTDGRYSQTTPGQYETPGYNPGPYPTYGPAAQSPASGGSAAGSYAVPGGRFGHGDDRHLDSQLPPNGDGTYVVQPNDNYWKISERLYGTGGYFQALARHNEKQFPDRDQLTAGSTISAPSIAELEKHYADLCPRPEHRAAARNHLSVVSTPSRHGSTRQYVVQEGDTLFDIARFELGKASRWAEIFHLNQSTLGDQYDYLTPGMKLLLPLDQPADKVTQRPSDVYRR